MARLLLFAGLREAAGQSRLEADAATVGELLDLAADQFGEEFRRGLTRSAVWVNGDPAESDQALDDGDEVAVIPPVSGGAQAVVSLGSAQSAVALVGLAALVAGSVFGQAAFAAALVGVAAIWVLDLKREGAIAGVRLALPPLLATIVAAVVGAHILGIAGLGLTAGFAVIAVLGWAVLRPEARDLEAVASTAVVGLVSGLAVASLYLVRARDDGLELILAFLLMVTAGALLAWAVMRFLPDIEVRSLHRWDGGGPPRRGGCVFHLGLRGRGDAPGIGGGRRRDHRRQGARIDGAQRRRRPDRTVAGHAHLL